MNINTISNRFKTFAERECKDSSRLYEFLSYKIAEDDELLELSSYAKEGQPVPNLFFGAVHYLLLKRIRHELRDYYPSIVEQPKPVEESFHPFKQFCQQYRDLIISILRVKNVQTNEVRRCAYLYPIFSYIFEKTKKPLALIEIGTSAGFQLLWDKYRYTYQSGEHYGEMDSDVHIQSEIRGEKVPNFPAKVPPVAERTGIDLHVNDVSDDEDSLWLNALIWPEHEERRNLFHRAVQSIRKYKKEIHLIEGDGVDILPQIVERIPQDVLPCVFHTHVANQMPEETKYRLLDNIRVIGGFRDIFHLYNNIWDRKLHLDFYINGIEHRKLIGETDGHGRWFTWEL